MALEAYNLLGQKGIKGERNPDPNLSDAEATYLYSREPGGYNSDNQGLTTTRSGEVVPVDQELHNKKLEDAGLIPLGSLTGRKTYTGLRADDTNNSEPTQSDNTSSSSNESERETLKTPTNVIDSIGALYKTQGGIGFWNSLKDKPQSTVIAQLLRDIRYEKIQITPEIKRELFNADIIEENLDEAREEGLSKYLNKYGSIYKPIEFVKDTEDKKLTSTVKPQDVVDYSIFGDDAVYVASAAKVLKSKNMSEALELLRKYNTVESVTVKEQEKNTVTIKESREAFINFRRYR